MFDPIKKIGDGIDLLFDGLFEILAVIWVIAWVGGLIAIPLYALWFLSERIIFKNNFFDIPMKRYKIANIIIIVIALVCAAILLALGIIP